jgi:hypothetical protein
MSENIVVAVRVRPFNEREKALSAKCCVDMVGNSTIVRDLDGSKDEKTFTFDYSFWSHDSFTACLCQRPRSTPIRRRYSMY